MDCFTILYCLLFININLISLNERSRTLCRMLLNLGVGQVGAACKPGRALPVLCQRVRLGWSDAFDWRYVDTNDDDHSWE